MPQSDIQALLDRAAAELGAAITLEDRDFRLLAHTEHSGVIDEFRRSMIIGRRVTPEVRSWFEQWGMSTAIRPFRTPPDERRGVLGRWCVPVRFRELPLGFVWVLDTCGIREDDLVPAIEAGDQIGALLYARRLASQADADLLRLLLTPKPRNEPVAAEARSLGTFAHNGPIVILVAGEATGEALRASALSDLTLAVQRAAEHSNSEAVLAGVISELGVMLAPLRSADDLGPAQRLAETVRRLALGHDLELVVGIGGSTELERASESFAEARRTLRMIRAVPDLGCVARWDDLGIFRALALLPTTDLQSGVLDARVRRLLGDEGLAATAETYLDLAGDVQATAARLFVHRTTLYQRLDRIAALYKLDLRRNGDHRLITHLGFKLARVAGA